MGDMTRTLSTRGVPAPPSLPRRLRLDAAILAGNLAAFGSRLAGKGSGASVRGQILTRLAPSAFADLLRGRRVLAVSGTNGKTTTTHLLAAAVRAGLGADAARVVTNADGANLGYGIASALSQARAADIAVLETDERVGLGHDRTRPSGTAGAAQLQPRPTRSPSRDQGAGPRLAGRPRGGRADRPDHRGQRLPIRWSPGRRARRRR